jgi:hypothetical protein
MYSVLNPTKVTIGVVRVKSLVLTLRVNVKLCKFILCHVNQCKCKCKKYIFK